MENKLPQRKHPRLKHYDYGSVGAYFITICTEKKKCILSRIVGRGLAPAETLSVEYTTWGKIAEKQLFALQNRYPHLVIDRYIIMPNHIHLLIGLNNEAAGASPRPTVIDIICTYKSLTTIECRKHGFSEKLFQTSFFEHIVRNEKDYDEISKYIGENPYYWIQDKLYSSD